MTNNSNDQVVKHYYPPDENGLPDFQNPIPMTRGELIEIYQDTADDEPASLADLYIDFHDFRQIEFLIFRDRLSSAVLIFNSVRQSLVELQSKFKRALKDGSQRTPGWEGESDEFVNEQIGVAEEAYKISLGATITTAVAALESLLIDLAPEPAPKLRGLSKRLNAFLSHHKVANSEAKTIRKMAKRVGDRRNAFAHALTGSYFERDKSTEAMFTLESMEDPLYSIGKVAVMIEGIVLAGHPG